MVGPARRRTVRARGISRREDLLGLLVPSLPQVSAWSDPVHILAPARLYRDGGRRIDCSSRLDSRWTVPRAFNMPFVPETAVGSAPEHVVVAGRVDTPRRRSRAERPCSEINGLLPAFGVGDLPEVPVGSLPENVQFGAAALETPTSFAAPRVLQPCARSCMNRCRLSDSGRRPGPFFTRRLDDNTTSLKRRKCCDVR